MREKLALINGRKSTFVGVFDKYGWRTFRGQYVGKTILLKDIKNSKGELVTEHLWFHESKTFSKLGKLKKGDILMFDARSQPYMKHRGEELDFKLAWPQNLRRVEADTLRESGQASL